MKRLVIVLVLAGCGGSSPAAPPPESPESLFVGSYDYSATTPGPISTRFAYIGILNITGIGPAGEVQGSWDVGGFGENMIGLVDGVTGTVGTSATGVGVVTNQILATGGGNLECLEFRVVQAVGGDFEATVGTCNLSRR